MNEDFLTKRQEFKAAITRRFGIDESVYMETTRLLAPIAMAVRFRKGQYLQRTGVPAQALFWLTSGVARIGFTSSDGEDLTLRFAKEGDSATTHDLFSSTSGTPAVFYIVAETAVEGFRLDWTALLRIRAQHEVAEKYHSRMLEYHIKQRAIDSSTHFTASARDRLAAFRADYPGLEARISQKTIASYLRITPQYLSQLLQEERGES